MPDLSSPVRSLPYCFYSRLILTAPTEGNKSATQKAGDATRSGGDNAQNEGQGVLGSVQDTLSNAGQSVSDTFNQATGNKK